MKRENELVEEKYVDLGVFLAVLEPLLLEVPLPVEEKIKLSLSLFQLNKEVARQLLGTGSTYWSLLLAANRDAVPLSSLRPAEWTTHDCWLLITGRGATEADYLERLELLLLFAVVDGWSHEDEFTRALTHWFMTSQHFNFGPYDALFDPEEALPLCEDYVFFLSHLQAYLPRELTPALVAQLRATLNPEEVVALLSPQFPPLFDRQAALREFERNSGWAVSNSGPDRDYAEQDFLFDEQRSYYTFHEFYGFVRRVMGYTDPAGFVLHVKDLLLIHWGLTTANTGLSESLILTRYVLRKNDDDIMAKTVDEAQCQAVKELYRLCVINVTPVFFQSDEAVRTDYFLFIFLLRMGMLSNVSLETVGAARQHRMLRSLLHGCDK